MNIKKYAILLAITLATLAVASPLHAGDVEPEATKKPPQVTTLKVKKIRKYGATLQWKKPDRTDYFKVQLLKKNGRNLKKWTNHSKRKRQIIKSNKLLKPGKTYRYRVKACNEIGCAKWSKKKKFNTLPDEEDVIEDDSDDSTDNGIGEPDPNASAEILALETEVHDLINEYRVSQGLSELTYSNSIATIAREHSANMATGAVDFGHDGFSDRLTQMAEAFGSVAYAGAENVAWMTERADMAEVAKDGWVASEGHRINIEGNYTYTGVGIAEQDGRYYFTQLFFQEY